MTKPYGICCLFFLWLSSVGMTQARDGATFLKAVGPDSRTFSRTGENGGEIVELETGMNYLKDNEWVPSESSFEVEPDAFVASKMQHKVKLNRELSVTGSVSVTTGDGLVLNSTPVAIGLYDAESGDSVIISRITSSVGTLVGTNQVVYKDAFEGVSADVLYTINKGSFEQDVIVTGRLNPNDFGFPAKTTRLQIFTEFFDAPEPKRSRRPLRVEPEEKIRKKIGVT